MSHIIAPQCNTNEWVIQLSDQSKEETLTVFK